MAIIYSYPEKLTPAGGDFLVITDSEQTAPNKNRTKSLTIDNLAAYVVTSTSGITGTGTINTVPVFTGATAIGNSGLVYTTTGGGSGANLPLYAFGGSADISTQRVLAIDYFGNTLNIDNIVASSAGTVTLKGDTIIGDANTDTLTVNAETTFADNVTINGNTKSLTMGQTTPIIFVDSLGAERLRIGGNITNNSIIDESGAGDLILTSNTEVEIKSGELGENFAKFTKDGPIELYYDNVKKFETSSNSIKILDVPVHADNAAASAAGLTVGEIYRTGDLLKIVH